MTYLQLDFGYVSINDKGAEFLSNGIKNLKNINYINISLFGNKIGDKGVYFLAIGILNLTKIENL